MPHVFGLKGPSALVVTGTKNRVAVFDDAGKLKASDSISTDELEVLDGASGNFEARISAIEALPEGKIYIGDATGQISEVTPSGDVTISTAGSVQIVAGAIVDADVNAAAAVARSKLASGAANAVVVNNGSGVMIDSSVVASELQYVVGNEPLTSFALLDNQATPQDIASWDTANYDVIEVEYSIARSGVLARGRAMIAASGVVGLADAQAATGIHGIALVTDLSAGIVKLQYTSTSTGSGGTFKYKVSKWKA